MPWIAGEQHPGGRDHYVTVHAPGPALDLRVDAWRTDGTPAPHTARYVVPALNARGLDTAELEGKLGMSASGWQLRLEADGAFHVTAYDNYAGRLAPLTDVAEYRDGRHHIPSLNRGGNKAASSFVLLVNGSDEAATANIHGFHADGSEEGSPHTVALGARETVAADVVDLERDGDGWPGWNASGKWRIEVEAPESVAVQGYVTDRDRLSNVSR